MKRVVFVLTIVLLFSCKSTKEVNGFNYDKITPELAELVKNLVETDYIGTERLGRTPEPSPAYANREALLALANEAELLVLMNHPEGEVAATAYEGLVRKDYELLKEELLNLGNGDRLLNYIKGDIFLPMPALEYAYVIVLDYQLDGPAGGQEPMEIGLSDSERAFIENRILAIRKTM